MSCTEQNVSFVSLKMDRHENVEKQINRWIERSALNDLHWSPLSGLNGCELGAPMLLRCRSALLNGLALTLSPDTWLPVDLA